MGFPDGLSWSLFSTGVLIWLWRGLLFAFKNRFSWLRNLGEEPESIWFHHFEGRFRNLELDTKNRAASFKINCFFHIDLNAIKSSPTERQKTPNSARMRL